MNKNDRWSQLSMQQRADLIRLYASEGITDLKQMHKHYNGIPYRDFNTSDYDYFNASPEMIPTEEGQHWDSRNPHTGQILKSENHPTFDLAVEGEKNAGYNIVRGYDGNLYSIPNQPDNYVEKPNMLDGTETEQALNGKPLTRRVAKSAYSYGSPEPIWDITNPPDITEWYDNAYNNASNTSPYPEIELSENTLTQPIEKEIPDTLSLEKRANILKKLTSLNLLEPPQFVQTTTPEEGIIKPISYPSLSRKDFISYVRTPVRNLRWKAQDFAGWSDEDLNYLYDRLGDAGWDPKALMYGIDKETNFRTHVKNENTSAIGLAQLTKDQMETLYGEDADKIYEEYANGTRSVRDVVDDTIKQYKWMYDRIKTEPENMGYGRLKVNLLAPNASLDSIVSDVIYKHSLTTEQKKHLKKGVSTYRDLMKVYDKEFIDRFRK